MTVIFLVPIVAWARPHRDEKPVLLNTIQPQVKDKPFNMFTVTALSWSPDGRTLAVGGESAFTANNGSPPWSEDNQVQLWDVRKRICQRVFVATPTSSNPTVAELAWALGGTFLAARHWSLRAGVATDAQTWNVSNGHIVTVKTELKRTPAHSLSIVTGIPHLVVGREVFAILRAERRANKNVCLVENRNLSTGRLLSTRLFSVRMGNRTRDAECAALSNDGRQLVMLANSQRNRLSINIFNARSSKLLRRFVLQKPRLPRPSAHNIRSGIGGSDFQAHIAFSRDGSTLAATIGYSSFLIVNARTGARRSTITMPHDVQTFAISSDGARLAVIETDGRFTLWNAHTGRLVRDMSHQGFSSVSLGDSDSQPLYKLAFSPNSATLAVASSGNNVALWPMR